ncbi:hypothetical protein B0T21DRAFT_356858 [Apiosordaria backusii]|uniref:AMP-activated protein kinase glycogen-binding domain-containing protein n=1 Tax=Apiosordaria backusii TaxID=314023 RepID=A0AA40K798_9PEZI|nr:hypothetical protein B0T21DRAFT_356858 [Apiosordaria backusii]
MPSDKIPAVITYQKPGTQPPIYVAGTFSNPPWHPEEMGYTIQEDGEHFFQKEVHGEPGSKHQYKFRIGNGDWWDLAPGQPTVTDESGNTNHVLEIQLKEESKTEDAPLDKGPTEVSEETQASKEPAEVPEETQTSEESIEASEDTKAPKEPTEVPEETQTPKEPTAEENQAPKELTEVSEETQAPRVGNKDSASSKVVLPSDSILQSIKAQEIRTQSGTGTPDFVRTAAEVADSAALLHEGVPDRDPRDGMLERAPTPMSKTATTAAEVADTAEVLDRVDAILISEPHPDDENLFGLPSEDQGQREDILTHKSPLFPHECPSPPAPSNAAQRRESRDEDRSPIEELDPDHIDFNDPTIERFPSNREGIIDTVRKLETSLNEDQAAFEGAPPSPVINSPLEGPQDVTDYILGDSSIPTAHRGSQHLEIPRPSHGSATSVPVSPSLQVISEAEEPANEEYGVVTSPIVFSNPDMKPRPSSLKPRSEEEDEGVSLKDGISPRTVEPVLDRAVTPDGATSAEEIQTDSQSTPPVDSSDNITPAKANGAPTGDHSNTHKAADEAPTQTPDADEGPATPGPLSVGERATDSEIAQSSRTTAVDTANNTTSLKKRGPPATEAEQQIPRVTSPISNRPTGVEPRHGVSWIQAFFRLLFVDIIGGFISRLCGGKRRNTTLMTAGTVAVLMGFGVGWWTLVGKSRGGLTR